MFLFPFTPKNCGRSPRKASGTFTTLGPFMDRFSSIRSPHGPQSLFPLQCNNGGPLYEGHPLVQPPYAEVFYLHIPVKPGAMNARTFSPPFPSSMSTPNRASAPPGCKTDPKGLIPINPCPANDAHPAHFLNPERHDAPPDQRPMPT